MRPEEEYRKLHYERNITFPLLRLNYKRFILERRALAQLWLDLRNYLTWIDSRQTLLLAQLYLVQTCNEIIWQACIVWKHYYRCHLQNQKRLNRFIVSYQQHQEIKFSTIKCFIILLWSLTSITMKKLTRPSVIHEFHSI